MVAHTQMGIGNIVIIRCPEEGTDDGRGFDAAKGQSENPHHLLIGILGEGQDLGHKGILVLGIGLDAGS